LQQLQVKYAALKKEAAALLEENTQLKEEDKNLKSILSSNEKELKRLDFEYKQLKAGSAEYLDLKEKYKTVSSKLAEQTKRANELDEKLSGLELNQYIKWFLAGSGVLLVGFIIGFSAKRGRRRPSLM
jgi:SH3 domain protein